MSIFKSTFSPHIQTQLAKRQDAMVNRTSQNLSYLNSRNAWIRMSSSVNVNGTNDLAKQYILQGGTLNNITDKSVVGTPKSGIGDFSNAYSNTGRNGNPYRLGIRPMPGITSLDIKSKSAYGSLREATINFQCWDINQLEDLELLYMRPGYTVLIEWGWVPYLDNNGVYQPNFTDYYDIINKTPTNRTTLFRELYEKSVQYAGNYDAMFGYVKNYQWSARMDGGYDCQVSVISTGEIIESLKINYLPAIIDSKGLLEDEFINQGNNPDWQIAYSKNALAGIWAETYYKLSGGNENTSLSSNSIFRNNFVFFSPNQLNLTTPNNANDKNSLNTNKRAEIYITLEAVFNVLNKYIIAKSSTDNEPLVMLSLDSTKYDSSGTTPNPLYCVAHPLQVSVDPSVCLINNQLWGEGTLIKDIQQVSSTDNTTTLAKTAYDIISKGSLYGTTLNSTKRNSELIQSIGILTNFSIYDSFKGILRDKPIYKSVKRNYSKLQEIFNGELVDEGEEELKTAQQIKIILEKNIPGIKINIQSKIKEQTTILENVTTIKTPLLSSITIEENGIGENIGIAKYNITQTAPKAIKNIGILNSLSKNYFYNDNPYSEIGILKNIYVNVNYLYEHALNGELESKDNKDKNEINLYNYVKKLMSDIQVAIGNINSFEIHVDPIDNNVARIIDVNYTEPDKASYDTLYTLPVHSLDSTVRNYSLQSQIFPDQSSIIAIGAQAKGGQLGIQTNTMIDFNTNLTDRIIKDKVDAQGGKIYPSENPYNPAEKYKVVNGLYNILNLFSSLTPENTGENETNKTSTKTIDNDTLADAKNSLRDLIAYFQSITKSSGSNRNLIPTKFSAEMDGIGGLVIGHMFRLPDTILPRGYRGDGVGSQLGNAITSIGHSISNGDWVTKIDSLNIVLNPYTNPNYEKFNPELLTKEIQITFSSDITEAQNTNKGFNQDNINEAMKFFISKGYSYQASAAFVGSFLQESQLNPTIVAFNKKLSFNDSYQTYAAGIAQWVGPRRVELLKYAKTKGINIPNYNAAANIKGNSTKTPDSQTIIESAFSKMTLNVQLEYVDIEAQSKLGFINFKNTSNLKEAVIWVYEKYEVGNYAPGAAFGLRGRYALDLYNRAAAGEFSNIPSGIKKSPTNYQFPFPTKIF